jgi:hypothetical protein
MYSAMIKGVETVLQSIGVHMDPACTLSDNCDAIQKSFIRYYPNGSIGGCFFHLLLNIKKKRSLWKIAVPSAISSSQKSRFVIRARDARERFAQEALRWLSTLSFIHEFTLFSDLFLQMLHSQGDSELSNTTQGRVFSRNQEGLGKMYDVMWKCWHKQLIGRIQWEHFRNGCCCGISYENGPVP